MATARKSSQSHNGQEIATLATRLLAFAVALAVIGAFFLPWVQLDGLSRTYSGAELMTLAVSPMLDYIYAVAPIQTAVLIGCPAAMLLLAAIVAVQYARRRTAIVATAAILAGAIAVSYGAPDLLAASEPIAYNGLRLIAVLAIALLAHQALLKLRTGLGKRGMFPRLRQLLSIATGSGRYRWRDARR